jgi:signal transduction histidine kinase
MVVMLIILMFPLISLYFFRFYENELVRKTELALITQSAIISATYRTFLNPINTTKVATLPSPYYIPVKPQLDLSLHPTLPRRPVAVTTTNTQDPQAWKVGQQLQHIIIEAQRTTLAGFRILDATGMVVAGRYERGQSLAHIPEVQRALQGNYTAVIRQRISDEPPPALASISRGTRIRIFTAFPIKDDKKLYGVVYLSRTPQNIVKYIYEHKEKVLLLVTLLISITLLIVFFISYHLVRPIRELTHATYKVTQGVHKTIDIPTQPGTYELAQLSESFKQMSIALNERLEYIHQFASHVSHEFKTPLTSMQGALELLQEHSDGMSIEQRNRFISNLLADTERMKQLMNRLLELARADSLQTSPQTTVVLPLLDKLTTHYKNQGLALTLTTKTHLSSHEPHKICVNIAKEAFESVLRNLLNNSLQHGATTVKITLNITTKKHLYLDLHDNGEGISIANQANIFTPFFTTKRETGGTGLGLDIVTSLLKVWHSSICLEKSTTGALFRLKLALA